MERGFKIDMRVDMLRGYSKDELAGGGSRVIGGISDGGPAGI